MSPLAQNTPSKF